MPDSFPPERPGLLRRLWGGGPEKAKTARLPINAYGKLPIYKDFISSGMTEPPAREFRAWLDKGFSHRWANDESCRGTEIPAHSFLLRLPESKGCAAGSLWGSCDEGGLRKFPFAIFLSFPAAHGAADPVAAVEYLVDVERRASELRFLFGPGSSLSSFYQAYRGAELEVPVRSREQVGREFRSELAGFTVGEFAESVLGSEAARGWPELLAAAAEAGDGAGALALPLGGRLPRAREIEFWLLWLDRSGSKRRGPVTGVLYPHGHNPGRAFFFFRDVTPDDFLLLHPTRAVMSQVEDALARVHARQRPPAASSPEPASAAPAARTEPAAPDQPGAAYGEPARVAPAAISGEPAAGEGVVEPASGTLPSLEPAADAVLAGQAGAASAVPPPDSQVQRPEDPTGAPPEESPFPEAEMAGEPTTGRRLSQILTLDRSSRTGGSAPAESLPREETGPAAGPPPVAAEPGSAPILALEPPPAAPQPPGFTAPEPPPTAAPASEAFPPQAMPAEPTPPPPGWERPLASLFDA